jgi:hypothetical protein
MHQKSEADPKYYMQAVGGAAETGISDAALALDHETLSLVSLSPAQLS